MYNIKIIETNDKIEIWRYEMPIHNNYSMSDFENNNKQRRKYEDLSYSEKVDSFKRKSKYYQERKHDIRRLIEMNYKAYETKFVTLTFRDHIEDVAEANNLFNKFIKRLKYKLGKSIKYIAVWERTKKNRIHYHLIIFNLKYMKWEELECVWKHGYIKINDVSHVERKNVGRYISKYFSKELDVKDMHKKAFFTSRNLKKPKKITLQSQEELKNLVDISNKSYSTKYLRSSKVDDVYIDTEVEYMIIEKDTK